MATNEPEHEHRDVEEFGANKDEDTGAQVAPIVRLEEVAVNTGEEDEDAVLDLRRLAVEGWSGCSSHVVANLAVTPALGFLCFVALRGVSGIDVRGSSSDLQEPLLVEGDRAKASYKVLKSNWKRSKSENPSRPPSLAPAILKSFWKEAACSAVFAGLNTLLSYVGPYMISYFVDYLGGKYIFPHECLLRQSPPVNVKQGMSVQEHVGNEMSCVWHARYFADGELKDEIFCIRFASIESEFDID
ncbi:unnamed protein product [Eruca vesicaria subsp. sativa]|uniref:Uncharacterized protein n=1 Tax=Eruca vesicaria subsp. sativa TaxID=29727 RepID=A0ABC8LLE9_ERUVS|nr:unnamed protein product [Eruca vesicaria subsp. sativa]